MTVPARVRAGRRIPDLSVIVPGREARPLAGVLENVDLVARQAGIDHEIVMATDPTIRAPIEPSLQHAIAVANGRYVVVLPADRTPPETWLAALWERRIDADIVVGSPLRTSGSDRPLGLRQRVSRLCRTMLARRLALPLIGEAGPYLIIGRRTQLQQLTCGATGGILTASSPAGEPTGTSFVMEVMLRAACQGYTVARTVLEGPLDGHAPARRSISVAEVSAQLPPLRVLWRAWVVRNAASAADYEERAFNSSILPQRWWQRRRFRIVLGFLDAADGRILDVGCGSSRIIQSLPEAVALDIALPKLRFLRRTNKRRVQASTFQLPFPGDCFDRVVHSEVIEHVPFSHEIFAELHRVLKPDGVLVIGTPDYGRPNWPIIEFFYGRVLPNAYADEHITHYTRRRLSRLLAEHGFEVIDHAYICGAELIVKAVKRGSIATGARP